MRMPLLRATARMRSSSSRFLLASLKPPGITSTARTPLAAQSSTTAAVASAGTVTMARSTGAGISRTERYRGWAFPATTTSPPLRLTANSSRRPRSIRFFRMMFPDFVWSEALTPTTATPFGSKRGRRVSLGCTASSGGSGSFSRKVA